MKKSQNRTGCDIRFVHQDECHDFCRNGNLSSFIRNRKMPLGDLLFNMMNWREGILAFVVESYESSLDESIKG